MIGIYYKFVTISSWGKAGHGEKYNIFSIKMQINIG